MSATSTWRPMHHALSPEAVALMTEQRAAGLTPLPIHLALVTDDVPQRFRVACDGGIGEWVTGSGAQVTCPGCLETVHA